MLAFPQFPVAERKRDISSKERARQLRDKVINDTPLIRDRSVGRAFGEWRPHSQALLLLIVRLRDLQAARDARFVPQPFMPASMPSFPKNLTLDSQSGTNIWGKVCTRSFVVRSAAP